MGKRLIALLMAVTMVAAPVNCFAENNPIKFRGYDWGTPHEEITKNEIEPDMVEEYDYVDSEDEFMRMYSDVAGYKMFALYEFNEDDSLCKGTYLLKEEHTNDTQYYYDFADLADKFTSLYGEPTDKQELWFDDLYKDKPSDWGMSFATGKSKFVYTWEDNDDNKLGLIIYGDNYEITVAAFYDSAEEAAKEPEVNTNGL